MSRRNQHKQKQQSQQDRQASTDQPGQRRWPVQQVLILAIGVVLGFALSSIMQDTTSRQAAPPATSAPAPIADDDGGPGDADDEGVTDAYGRSPGDPHYGHNHP